MHLLAPFILENLKKRLRADGELWGYAMCHCAIFREKIFLVEIIVITFIFLLALFTAKNFKNFWQRIQSYEDNPIFETKMVHLTQTNFWGRNYYYLFHLPISSFHSAKLKKKILPADPDLRGCALLGPKMAYFPKWKCYLENLLMISVFVIQAYLHAKN